VVFVCLASPLRGTSANQSDARERAQQIAAEAQDYAVSLEERQLALQKLQESARLFLSIGSHGEAAAVLNRVGRLQFVLSRHQDAIESYQQALSLVKASGPRNTEVDSLNGLAMVYLKPKWKQAREILETALRLSERENYVAGSAEALLEQSQLENNNISNAVALQTAQRALALWMSLGDKRGLARTYSQIGQCSLAQNILSDATQNYEAALQLWRELNDVPEQAEVLINLSIVEYRRANWPSSISLLTQAEGLIDERAEPGKMGQIHAILADTFNRTGLPENSIIHYRRAMEYYQLAEDSYGQVYSLWGSAWSHYLLERFPEALDLFNLALSRAQRKVDVALCNEYLGRVFLATGEYPAALRHLRLALATYNLSANPRESAQVLALLAQIAEKQGQFGSARQNYRQALAEFQRLSDRANESVVYYALGRLELKQDNLEAAEDFLRQSIDITEDIRRTFTVRDLTAAFSATVHERYESYIECLMRKHQKDPTAGFAVRAFEISERARARSLAEVLRATQTNLIAGLDPHLAEQERTLRQSLQVKEDDRITLLGKAYKKEDLDSLDAELAQVKSDYKQVTATIQARYPAYAQITKPADWTLSQIQQQVVTDDQTLLLEYSLGTNRSYVWAVTHTEISSYELPGRAQIEAEARRFYELLSAGQSKKPLTSTELQDRIQKAQAELPDVAAALSKTLLTQVANQLGKKRLIIVADGFLQYIPFQTLSLPVNSGRSDSVLSATAEDARPLILDHEIINEPSASILGLVSSESANRKPAKGSVAVLADPVFEINDPRVTLQGSNVSPGVEGFQKEQTTTAFRDVGQSVDGREIPRLLASREEARAIMNVVPWRTGFEATDFEANRATVTGPQLEQYRVVHFATHAFLDDKNPEASGIFLSLVDKKGLPQRGFLGLNDIYSLKLPVDLVVLSACNTGLGKDVKGEGLIGLTRGFMYAGAGGVAASLWRVDDEATAELMKHFYEGMFKGGLTPAQALQQAQITIWKQKRWKAPYFWAGFVIQGQYDQKVNGGLASPGADGGIFVWGLLGIGLSLTVFFLIWQRRRRAL
jgi:CHAT domain-containing protein